VASGKITCITGFEPRVIANGTDLNDLTHEGTYVCASATDAASLVNCPYSATAFTMIVLQKNSVLQTCGQLMIGGGSLYFRDSSSSGFTKWKRLQGTELT